jgi:preprotein translocase SecE subunit
VADEPSTKKRRIVRNPETFRERAIKAAETSDKPSRKHRIRGGVGKVLRPIFVPIGKVLKKIFYRQPFKFIGRILLPKYFRNSWKELKLVTWPNWKQSRQLTFAVLAFAIVFGAAVAGLDYGLDKVFKSILLK